MRTFARLVAAASLLAVTAAHAFLAGPVFPPPRGHSFTVVPGPEGQISRAGGATFQILVPAGFPAPIYFGPAAPYVRLDFNDPGPSNLQFADPLTYQAGESNLPGGIAVWRGTTQFLDGALRHTRFTITTSAPLFPATDFPGIAGIAGSVGAIAQLTPGSLVTINHKFEASSDGGSTWQPALNVFDAYLGPKTAARSSYSYGYYYENTAPTVSDTPDQTISLGGSRTVPVTISDVESPANDLVVTVLSTNQAVIPNGSFTIPVTSSPTQFQNIHALTLTPVGLGVAEVSVRASDGSVLGQDTFSLTVTAGPYTSDIPNQTTTRNIPTAAIAFTLGDSDTPLDQVTLVATSGNQVLVPDANIALGGSGASRTVTITPASNQFGTTTITLTATDPQSNTWTETFDLLVNAQPRFTVNTGAAVPQGGFVDITSAMMTAVDDDGADSQITYTIDVLPQAGILARSGTPLGAGGTFTQQDVNDGLLRFTHDNSCTNPGALVIGAQDSLGGVMRDGAFTLFNFNIGAVFTNAAPVANNQSLDVGLGSAANGTLTASNTDCVTPVYTYSIVAQPAKGTISNFNPGAGTFTYTPNPGESGADSFTFGVSDGVMNSAAPGVVTITIANQKPVVTGAGAMSVVENGAPASTQLAATDPDLPAQNITWRIGTAATRGTASVSASGLVSYTPGVDRMGADSFTVIANDGLIDSDPAAFTVDIRALVVPGRYFVTITQPPAVKAYNATNLDYGTVALLPNTGPNDEARGIAAGSSGLFVAAQTGGAGVLYRIDNGTATAIAAPTAPGFGPVGVAVEADGNVVVTRPGVGVTRYSPAGAELRTYSGGNLAVPAGIGIDGSGNLWIGDGGIFASGDNKVITIAPDAPGTQTVVATGNGGGLLNTAGGVPIGLVVHTTGDAYVSMGVPPNTGSVVLKVTPAGAVTQAASGLSTPIGITSTDAATLAVANYGNGSLATFDAASGTVTPFPPFAGAPKFWGIARQSFGVPAAATGVTATAGNAQATVAFTAAPGATGYTVTSSPGGITATGNGSPVVVGGLTNGTAYTFTVTATNSVGSGPPSAPSNSVTPMTVPGAPTAVSATAGNTQATVSFTAPASNGGSAITGYTVTSNPGGTTANGTASPITVMGLTNGVAYTFTVTAANAAGTGPASSASNSVTPMAPATVPAAPTGVSATAGNTAATIAFTAPGDGGSPITGYTVSCTPGPVTGSGSASPITVTGLTNGTLYSCTVTATNAVGTGPASSPATVTPQPGTFLLSVAKSGTGGGSVTSNPAGIDCGSTCAASFTSGASVALTAAADAGSVFAGWSGACTGTAACNVTMDAAKSVTATFTNPPRLGNISTRMQVLTGNDVLIGGFVIGGAANKTIVVRARGPSLIPFGITNALANPMLQLVRSSDQATIATNDDWQSATNAADITASGFAPSNNLESAILVSLPPGAYTAIVSGLGNATGVGIVEVFEVDGPQVPLVNISTRGQVRTGNDVMIGGFVITGNGSQTVVVRARGPSLIPFGITNALPNPVLQLVRSSDQQTIATNDDWQSASNAADITASGFAPSNNLESAILMTLQPGAYTAIVTGSGGATGVGIVEVFTVTP